MAKKKSTTLYVSNDTYKVTKFKSRKQWLLNRDLGIGGSDVAPMMNKSRFKTAVEWWEEKTDKKPKKDISKNPAVEFGSKAEKFIRDLFELEYKDKYEVQYVANVSLQNQKFDYLFYSPDGLLLEKETGRKGILEIKTSTIHNNYDEWKERIPDEYYYQILHGLLVTGFDFVVLKARLKFIRLESEPMIITRHYVINRSEVLEDLSYLLKEEIDRFDRYILRDEKPPVEISL